MDGKPDTEIQLKIADILIKMQSEFGFEQCSERELQAQRLERFINFLYKGEEEPSIVIRVHIVDSLPEVQGDENIFITYHPEHHNENWRLQKKGDTYIYRNPLEHRRQVMFMNQSLDRVTAYLEPQENKGRVWKFTDIIYDFLQVLLINYFALNDKGVFVHSIGVKDSDGRGLLFAGKSGSGKSTTARIWHNHSKAMVLNDDRVIVRRLNGKFFIYGSPWHGEFDDYLQAHIESAPLEKLFFIYHASKNEVQRIPAKEAFSLLYPTLFPAFWDRGYLGNVASFCQGLVQSVPCFRLGFINNKEVIEFVRNV